jgi:hypothetical protein
MLEIARFCPIGSKIWPDGPVAWAGGEPQM